MRKRWMIGLFLTAALVLAGCGPKAAGNYQNQAKPTPPAQQTQQPTQPTGQQPATTGVTKQWTQPPAMQIDQNKQYFATLKTSLGDIRIQLFVKDAPVTVNNFVFLANEHFYDGVKFHRIIKTFMIQTGDPKGNGTGGPGYRFKDELPPKRSYDPGIVAMANSGPNTNGSQFFICTGADCKASLDPNPNYTQFGQVVAGMDVVQKIAGVPVKAGGSDPVPSTPVQPPIIESVTIETK
ncbi:MAG: peptidylprolyl isomerase [Mycobacterium leprae]